MPFLFVPTTQLNECEKSNEKRRESINSKTKDFQIKLDQILLSQDKKAPKVINVYFYLSASQLFVIVRSSDRDFEI